MESQRVRPDWVTFTFTFWDPFSPPPEGGIGISSLSPDVLLAEEHCHTRWESLHLLQRPYDQGRRYLDSEDGEAARWREAMSLRPPVRSWASPETAYLWLVLISNRRATWIKLNYSSLLFKYLVPWTQWRITNWYTSIPTTSWDEDSGWCIIWLQP